MEFFLQPYILLPANCLQNNNMVNFCPVSINQSTFGIVLDGIIFFLTTRGMLCTNYNTVILVRSVIKFSDRNFLFIAKVYAFLDLILVSSFSYTVKLFNFIARCLLYSTFIMKFSKLRRMIKYTIVSQKYFIWTMNDYDMCRQSVILSSFY